MTADACRSIQMLFLSSLLIIVVWLLSWPEAVGKLTLYGQTQDLHAWLALREMLDDSSIGEAIYDFDPDETVSEFTKEKYDKESSGDVYEVQYELKATLTWPNVDEIPITLIPHNEIFESINPVETRAYIVSSDETHVFDNYIIVFVRDKNAVVPRSTAANFKVDPTAFRILEARLGTHFRPVCWDNLSLHLASHGFTGRPAELNNTNAALIALQVEIDPRVAGDVQVFGLSLSIALFFSSVGVLLAGVSFSLLGPLSVLRGISGEMERTTWVFVIPVGTSRSVKGFDILLNVFCTAWAVTPLLILYLQHSVPTNFDGLELWGLWIGTIGLLFSVVIWFYTVLTLHRIRRVETKVTD